MSEVAAVSKFNDQSVGEEVANAVSHGLGTGLSIAGIAVLMCKAAMRGSALSIVGMAIYGLTLIVLFLNSTLYHSIMNYNAKKVFQVFDHSSIFLLIFGTYTPVTLLVIGGAKGWILFGFILTCAVTGILLTAIDLYRFDPINQWLYVIMGWSVIFCMRPVMHAVPFAGLIWLFAGGILYTVGIIFYRMHRKYAHFIWHWFVLGGAVCHFFFVYGYCLVR